MVFNASFNNISAISWRSVLLVEETGVDGENHLPVTSHWQISSHKVVSSTPRMSGIRTRLQLQWWWALIAQVIVNSTTIRSRPRRPCWTRRVYQTKFINIMGCFLFCSIFLSMYLNKTVCLNTRSNYDTWYSYHIHPSCDFNWPFIYLCQISFRTNQKQPKSW